MTAQIPRYLVSYQGDEWGYCACCGEVGATGFGIGFVMQDGVRHWRCKKHYGRNPCVIPGCHRTCAAPKDGRLSNDSWICSEHWKRYVPPRSLERQVYHRFFRVAKRHGWSPKRMRSFYRFWGSLVKRVRRRAEVGHIDQAEIERLFGWSEDS